MASRRTPAALCGAAILAAALLATPPPVAGAIGTATPGRASHGCGSRPPTTPGETGVFSLRVGTLHREYRLHLPPAYDPSRATSLVLDFHGYTGTAEAEEAHTGLSRHADAHGYLVVYPQGTGFVTASGRNVTSWNDLAGNASPGPNGPTCSETADQYPHPPECGEPRPCNWATCHDDLGFIAALLDRLEDTLCIDLDRVYATGMSNGAMFVHRLGCEMPQRLAAIAPVGGTLARGFDCAPRGSTPLSLINVYGHRDDYVSQRGDTSSDGYYYTSAEALLREWADPGSQACDATATPYRTSHAGTLGLVCLQRAGCATGAEVVHCTWDGGHEWPKRAAHDLGNEIIWEFFSRHSRARYRTAPER